jgi:ATP synthase subunit 6
MQFLYQLSALEQFDIIRVISHCKYSGVSNVGLASIYTTILMLSYFYVVFDSIYLSRDLMLKRFFLFSIYRTVKENFNVKNVTYFRFIASIFFVILFGNVTGLIPYYLTTTSYLVITLFISSVCFIGLNIIGIRLHGQKLFSLFVPEGTPFILTPFLIIIEIISYLARVASLSIRLFANMMAGHSLLKILAGFL